MTYTLINRSEHPLELLRVYESCSCSQVQFSGGILAPNQKTEMKVKLKLGNTRGPNELLIPVEYKREGSEEKEILLLKAQAVCGPSRY